MPSQPDHRTGPSVPHSSAPRAIYTAAATLVVTYIVYRISKWLKTAYFIRTRYKDIPSLPRHFLWGNLINTGERLNPSLGRHPDYGFEEVWKELGEPGCFLVDLAPVEDRGLLIIAEPQHVEALVNPREGFKYSLPKSETYDALTAVIGPESIITKDGSEWKTFRKRFNPGFQPKHIHSLSNLVVSKTNVFVERLRSAAKDGLPFKMVTLAQDLTTDIITEITLAKDFKAQTTPEGFGEKSAFGFLTANRLLSEYAYATGQGIGLHMIDPIRPLKAKFYDYLVRRKLTPLVRDSVRSQNQNRSNRSILQLAVTDVEPSEHVVHSSVDQIKSFTFAGQDTTATLIQWMCYEMSKARYSTHHAEVLSQLRKEHDEAFGPEPFSALAKLSSDATTDSELIISSKLPYTMAFVKETLRLHPPAATVRIIPEEATDIRLELPSGSVFAGGLRCYPCVYLIHRNPHVWGPDAHEFKPDRFLDQEYMANLPQGAWRPFERGPRNCIGQELAILEGVLVLVAVARGFVFEKVGLTGQDGEREVWNALRVTSVPSDGMSMRVHLNDR